MAGQTLNELQKAIYQTLTGNAPLMALVMGVFDLVPEDTQYPYIVFDAASSDNKETLAGITEKIRLTIEVYSKEAGRKNLQTIIDQIHALLHHAPLNADAGFELKFIECATVQTELLSNGTTWRGRVTINALVQHH